MALRQNRPTLYTSAQLHCTSSVGAGTRVSIHPGNLLEAVSVNHERAPTRAAANEVVSRVPHNQADIVFPSKVDAGLYMRLLSGHNDVDTIVPKRTWL